MAPSPYWGDEADLGQPDQHAQPDDGREGARLVHRAHPPSDNPDFCKKGSNHPSAKVFPIEQRRRGISPCTIRRAGKFTLISTCFPTHHLIFAEDANHTLWTSSGGGGSGVIGWLESQDVRGNRRRGARAGLDAVHPRHQRQRQARRVGRAEPAGRSRRRTSGWRSTSTRSPSIPLDGSVWGTSLAPFPSYVVRVAPGSDPDAHRAHRDLRAAVSRLRTARRRHRPQRRVLGIAVERPSRQLRPAQVQGTAERAERRDGQALSRRLDAPSSSRARSSGTCTDDGSAESSYYTWVDQFNTFGLGENVPIATGNLNDSLLRAGRRQVRQPARALPDGLLRQVGRRAHRRSECAAGRGKAAVGDLFHRTVFHVEGGKENRPKVVKFQMRPDPLAR